ncbi:MAG: hypothetical protein KJ574_01510 [Nanoarchaeota archaeon]|nr:hypothetical protein [Nanoarchaeota archaeon]
MKHTLKITLVLLLVFLLAQVIGLAVLNQYVDRQKTEETGITTYKELPLNIQRPEIEQSQSYIFIIAAVIIGTILVLLLIRFRGEKLWKLWFFAAAALCLTIAFKAFINEYVALAAALVLAFMKVFRDNFYVHNFTELFIYGGLAAIFVPIMDLKSAIIILVLISLYDAYAVWQSKHMIKMADFQSKSKVFAGLMIPYSIADLKKQTMKRPAPSKSAAKVKVETKNAILGGGDIGFPLLFAGVLLKTYPFLQVLIVPLITSLALFMLLYFAKKDRFYPAMPFLSAGCLVGYLILWLI